VQIVDARNPLLFRCEDLERYVLETSQEKMNVILINKADFLSEKQRQQWAEYFDSINLPVAFFSALEENQNHQLQNMKIDEEDEPDDDDSEYEDIDEDSEEEDDLPIKEAPPPVRQENKEDVKEETKEEDSSKNRSRLLSRGELIELFKTIHKGMKVQENRTVVGLVGYPNVGKSSTINSLLTYKKVSVSATPGKTKHFQVQYQYYLLFKSFIYLNISLSRP